jgi:hypothetical protein
MKVWFLSGEMNEDSNMFIESEMGREYPFRNPLYFKVESTTPVDPAGGHCYRVPTKPCESQAVRYWQTAQ